jgi:hypothetical protein
MIARASLTLSVATFYVRLALVILMVLRSSAVDLIEGEDIPETTHPVAETGEHGRRQKLPSEPQTGIAQINNIQIFTKRAIFNYRSVYRRY